MERVVEIAKQVWASTFKHKASVQIVDGEVMIDDYISIAPGKVEFRRVSLLGEEITEEDGYVVTLWKSIPATYMDPPDVDEVHLGESISAYDAVEIAAQAVLSDICHGVFESMSYAEYIEEQDAYAKKAKLAIKNQY